MKVEQLMTPEVFTVTDRQTLNDAAQLMWDHDCGCIPVLSAEDGQLVSVVTDRDIAMAAYTSGKCLGEIPVTAAHSQHAIFAGPEEDISAVEARMQSNQVRRIPVVNEAAQLVGIISLNDIAIASTKRQGGVTAKEVSGTLAAICKPRVAAEWGEIVAA